MRVFLGLLGAIIGALAGVFFLGPLAGDLYVQSLEIQDPVQIDDAHGTAFLGTTLGLMLVGYFIGLVSGWLVERADRD